MNPIAFPIGVVDDLTHPADRAALGRAAQAPCAAPSAPDASCNANA